MHRRDLLATLLGLLPAGVWSDAAAIVRTAAAAVERAARDDGEDESDGESGAPHVEPSDGHATTRTAVVDRLEGDVAVLVFEDPDATRTVPTAVLPPPAREAGIVLRVPQGNAIALATVDRAATARRRRVAGDRFDDLAEPAPDPGDDGNATAPDASGESETAHENTTAGENATAP